MSEKKELATKRIWVTESTDKLFKQLKTIKHHDKTGDEFERFLLELYQDVLRNEETDE